MTLNETELLDDQDELRNRQLHYQAGEILFNEYAEEFGLDAEFDLEQYHRGRPKSLARNLQYLQADGRMFPNAVYSAVEVAHKLTQGENVALLGLVQSGKTYAQIVGTLLAAVIYRLQTGKQVQIVFHTPIGSTYQGQFQNKLDRIMDAIGKMVVSSGDDAINLDGFLQLMNADRARIIGRIRARAKKYLSNADYAKLDAVFTELSRKSRNFVVPFSTGKGQNHALRYLMSQYEEENVKVFSCRDEVHWGAAQDSVNDRQFEEFYDQFNNNPLFQIVLCSATNWGALHLDRIHLKVGTDYCGLEFGYEDDQGRRHHVARSHNITIRRPEITSLTQFARNTGNPFLPLVQPEKIKDAETFDRFQKNPPKEIREYLAHNPKTAKLFYNARHDQYRNSCDQAIIQAIMDLFANNATDKQRRNRGALLRYIILDDYMKQFILKVKKAMPNLHVVQAFGDTFDSIEDLLDREGILHSNKRYLVIVTARGRMSDSFPADCGYGLDLTRESEFITAVLQGVVGRLSGYRKDPFVVVSDKNHEFLQQYVENDYIIPDKWSNRAVPGYRRDKKQRNVVFARDNPHPLARQVVAGFQRYVDFAWSKKSYRMHAFDRHKFPLAPTAANVLALGQHRCAELTRNAWDETVQPIYDQLNDALREIDPRVGRQRLLVPGEDDGEGGGYTLVLYKDNGEMKTIGPVITVRNQGYAFSVKQGGRDAAAGNSGRNSILLNVTYEHLGKGPNVPIGRPIVDRVKLMLHRDGDFKSNVAKSVPAKIKRKKS